MSERDDYSWVFVLALAGAAWWWFTNDDADEGTNTPLENFTETPKLPLPDEPMRVTANEEGTVYLVDPSTVTGSRDSRRGWLTLDHSNDTSTQARTSRELIWTNCDTGEVKTLARVVYDPEGGILYSRDYEFAEAATRYFAPSMIGSAAPALMCDDDWAWPE